MTGDEPLHCVNHPDVETYLRCNRCERPICAKCAVLTPVGYRCRDCISNQQRVFYAEFRSIYYLIAALVTLPLALIAGWLIPRLGWFTIFLGPTVGTGIAEAAHWAIRRRRGRYTWLVVCGGIVLGWSVQLAFSILPRICSLASSSQGYISAWGSSWIINIIWHLVYIATAVGAAYARLRPGRRV